MNHSGFTRDDWLRLLTALFAHSLAVLAFLLARWLHRTCRPQSG